MATYYALNAHSNSNTYLGFPQSNPSAGAQAKMVPYSPINEIQWEKVPAPAPAPQNVYQLQIRGGTEPLVLDVQNPGTNSNLVLTPKSKAGPTSWWADLPIQNAPSGHGNLLVNMGPALYALDADNGGAAPHLWGASTSNSNQQWQIATVTPALLAQKELAASEA